MGGGPEIPQIPAIRARYDALKHIYRTALDNIEETLLNPNDLQNLHIKNFPLPLTYNGHSDPAIEPSFFSPLDENIALKDSDDGFMPKKYPSLEGLKPLYKACMISEYIAEYVRATLETRRKLVLNIGLSNMIRYPCPTLPSMQPSPTTIEKVTSIKKASLVPTETAGPCCLIVNG